MIKMKLLKFFVLIVIFFLLFGCTQPTEQDKNKIRQSTSRTIQQNEQITINNQEEAIQQTTDVGREISSVKGTLDVLIENLK